jgi:hypothetical protein
MVEPQVIGSQPLCKVERVLNTGLDAEASGIMKPTRLPMFIAMTSRKMSEKKEG